MNFDKKVYWLSFWFIRSFYRNLLLGEVEGLNNVPRTGSIILASNHASHLDPPLLGCNILRIITYFARKTLWKKGIGAAWMDAVGAIPIDRDGESDIKAMKRTLAAEKWRRSHSLPRRHTQSRRNATIRKTRDRPDRCQIAIRDRPLPHLQCPQSPVQRIETPQPESLHPHRIR